MICDSAQPGLSNGFYHQPYIEAVEGSRFRLVRCSGVASISESRAYRVESVDLMTEQEAMLLMRQLGSPYIGNKYPSTSERSSNER